MAETDQISTDEINWVDAFNTTVKLKDPGCIALFYSGEVALLSGTEGQMSGQLRALIDGVKINGGNPYVSPDDNAVGRFETEGHIWWVCGLRRGTYTIQIQFKSAFASAAMVVRNRTLIVQYKR